MCRSIATMYRWCVGTRGGHRAINNAAIFNDIWSRDATTWTMLSTPSCLHYALLPHSYPRQGVCGWPWMDALQSS